MYIPMFYSICLATIGVCVFRCADFSWRTFLLYGGNTMKEKMSVEKLREYSAYFYKYSQFPKAVVKATSIASLIHIFMLIICLANTYALTGWNMLENLSKIPVIRKIPAIFPFYSSSIWSFLLCSILTIYVLPGILHKQLVSGTYNRITPIFDPAPEISDDYMAVYESIKKTYSCEGAGCGILCMEILLPIVLGIFVEFVAVVIFAVLGCITTFLWFAISEGNIGASPYGKTYEELKKLEPELKKYIADCKKEAELKQQQQVEEEKKQELARQAHAAESQYLTIENPEDQEDIVRQLADLGSASACLHYGRKLNFRYFSEALTQREKEELAKTVKTYLKISADSGNIEGQFLLLNLRAMTEAHACSGWEEILQQARDIKASGKLPEHYNDAIDALITTTIEQIDALGGPTWTDEDTARLAKKLYGEKSEPQKPDWYNDPIGWWSK